MATTDRPDDQGVDVGEHVIKRCRIAAPPGVHRRQPQRFTEQPLAELGQEGQQRRILQDPRADVVDHADRPLADAFEEAGHAESGTGAQLQRVGPSRSRPGARSRRPAPACPGRASTRGRLARSGHCPPAAESRAARRRRPGRRRSRSGCPGSAPRPAGPRRISTPRPPRRSAWPGRTGSADAGELAGRPRAAPGRRHGGSASRSRRQRAPASGRRSPSTGRRSPGQDQQRQ